MLYNDKDCQVLTIRDISAQENLEIAEEKNNLLHLLTSSVSHELMTPIRCMISFGQELFQSLTSEKKCRKAFMIVNTGKLLLSQVKMLLDRGMLENGHFTP